MYRVGYKINTSAWVFCLSQCADLECPRGARRRLEIAAGLSAAVQYLHRGGGSGGSGGVAIIHRDVKPLNLLIEEGTGNKTLPLPRVCSTAFMAQSVVCLFGPQAGLCCAISGWPAPLSPPPAPQRCGHIAAVHC